MAKYDDASWHYGGDYPNDLPIINAYTHIGMFLTWCIDRNLISEEQMEEAGEELAKVKNRTLNGAEFLDSVCDGKFTTDDLDDTGNSFAKAYYGRKEGKYASYFDDYKNLFHTSAGEFIVYSVPNSWENYERIKSIIDKRFEDWKTFQ